MSNMYCMYSGLKCKIKKRNCQYIITSRVKKDGFTNYIDVLGNEHSELYMKIVNSDEVDVIYSEDVFIKYKDKFSKNVEYVAFLISSLLQSITIGAMF